MNINKYYGHFLLLMILVLVLIMAFAYNNAHEVAEHKKRALDQERFLLTQTKHNLTLEDIVESIIYAMYESELVPVSSKADTYTRYQVWHSFMMRRGVPDVYITHEVYDELYKHCQKITPQNIESIVRPIYERERRAPPSPPPTPFCPVCLNY